MKIAIFSTYDNGGAGKAAFRLNKGLQYIGKNSKMFVKYKSTTNNNVVKLHNSEVNNFTFEKLVNDNFINNIYEGNTIVTAMYPSIGFNYLEQFNDYDIFNLHWISTFISIESIVKMDEMGKPIIWTLHDQNPMTGACHYTHGCEKYKSDCSACPQLKENPYNITKSILDVKVKYLPKKIVVVTPSRWLAECAKSSSVFKNHRIEVIPNSLETDVFTPIDKVEAKKRLEIPVNAKVILFGAYDLNEKRKGFLELIEIIKHLLCSKNDLIRKLLSEKRLYLLTFGKESRIIDDLGLPYKALGYIDKDEDLVSAYSAADVLALTSLEDNLPNIMLESMACGTPVVSFAVGGMNDMIRDGENGYLVPKYDLNCYAERLKDTLENNFMSSKCRSFAVSQFRLEIQANRYLDLFKELLNNKPFRKKTSSNVPVIFPEIYNSFSSYIYEAIIDNQNYLEQLQNDMSYKDEIQNTCMKWIESLLFDAQNSFLLNQSIKKVAIFGTQKIANYLHKYLLRNEIEIMCFLDNNKSIQNSKLNNITIYSPNWLTENYDEIDAVILSIEGKHDVEIKKQISCLINNKKPIFSWKEIFNT